MFLLWRPWMSPSSSTQDLFKPYFKPYCLPRIHYSVYYLYLLLSNIHSVLDFSSLLSYMLHYNEFTVYIAGETRVNLQCILLVNLERIYIVYCWGSNSEFTVYIAGETKDEFIVYIAGEITVNLQCILLVKLEWIYSVYCW